MQLIIAMFSIIYYLFFDLRFEEAAPEALLFSFVTSGGLAATFFIGGSVGGFWLATGSGPGTTTATGGLCLWSATLWL